MKAAVRLSGMERLLMNVNTHHYSFLEGEKFESAKDKDLAYRLFTIAERKNINIEFPNP